MYSHATNPRAKHSSGPNPETNVRQILLRSIAVVTGLGLTLMYCPSFTHSDHGHHRQLFGSKDSNVATGTEDDHKTSEVDTVLKPVISEDEQKILEISNKAAEHFAESEFYNDFLMNYDVMENLGATEEAETAVLVKSRRDSSDSDGAITADELAKIKIGKMKESFKTRFDMHKLLIEAFPQAEDFDRMYKIGCDNFKRLKDNHWILPGRGFERICSDQKASFMFNFAAGTMGSTFPDDEDLKQTTNWAETINFDAWRDPSSENWHQYNATFNAKKLGLIIQDSAFLTQSFQRIRVSNGKAFKDLEQIHIDDVFEAYCVHINGKLEAQNYNVNCVDFFKDVETKIWADKDFRESIRRISENPDTSKTFVFNASECNKFKRMKFHRKKCPCDGTGFILKSTRCITAFKR